MRAHDLASARPGVLHAHPHPRPLPHAGEGARKGQARRVAACDFGGRVGREGAPRLTPSPPGGRLGWGCLHERWSWPHEQRSCQRVAENITSSALCPHPRLPPMGEGVKPVLPTYSFPRWGKESRQRFPNCCLSRMRGKPDVRVIALLTDPPKNYSACLTSP